MADDVLRASGKVFLPKHPSVGSVLRRIQPERFYERLLQLTSSDRRRLALWRVLSLPYKPNVNHYFITRYSWRAHVPVFTTNFDTLLEQAAESQGIRINVIQGADTFGPRSLVRNKLNILKLHGTIGADGDVSGIRVMMTEISRFNPGIIQYIQAQMERRHLVVVGYSGRDLDHFPFIREKSKDSKSKRIFWINAFHHKRAIDYKNALSVGQKGASIIFDYPNEYLLSLPSKGRLSGILKVEEKQVPQKLENITKANLKKLKEEAAKGLSWTDAQKHLFLGNLLEALGEFRKSQQVLVNPGVGLDTLTGVHRYLLNWCLWSDAHNLSEFSKMSDYLPRMEGTRTGDSKLDALLRIDSLIADAEFHRMQIPFMSFVYGDFASHLFRGALEESYRYGDEALNKVESIVEQFKLGMGSNVEVDRKSPNEVFQIHIQQEILEHKVRMLTTEQQLVKDFLCLPRHSHERQVLKAIDEEWVSLRDECYRLGYYSGLANCHRHRYRTLENEEEMASDLDRAKNITLIANLVTTGHLIDQQSIDSHMRCGKVNTSKVKESTIMNVFKQSLKLENYLNALKAFLSLVEFDRLTNPSWNYEVDFERRAKQLDQQFDGGLSKTLKVIHDFNPMWDEYLTWIRTNYGLLNSLVP